MKQGSLVVALCLGSFFLASCSSKAALEAPQGLVAVPGENKIELSWQDKSDNEAGFAIYRRLASESSFSSKLDETPSNTESYTDSNVNTANTYVYQVRAVARDGSESSPSEIGEAVAATKLAAPSNLSATPGENKIDLTWSDNSSLEDGFKIYRRLESEASFPEGATATVGADATSYSDEAVSAGSSYVYQVIAFAGENVSEASNTSAPATATTPTQNPAAPVISSFSAPENDTSYAVGTKIELSWNILEQDQVTELRLEQVGGATIALSGTNATSATVTLPNSAGATTYKLSAKNAVGGVTSKDLIITTGVQPQIVNLVPRLIKGRDILLTWTMAGTGPFDFEVTINDNIPTTPDTKPITPTVSSGEYTYKVTLPPREDDNSPHLLSVTSDYGSAPNEKAEGTSEEF